MGKKDPALTYLKSYGYSVVRLPRQDILPGQIFARRNNDLSERGSLANVFTPGSIPLPKIRHDVVAADISGSVKTTLSLGLGLTLLGGFLKAFGVNASINASYKRAASVTFEFKGLRSDVIETVELERFLNAAHVTPGAPATEAMLDDDQLYAITRTLKSRSFVVDAADENGKSVAIDLPAIKEALGAKVNAESEGNSSSKIHYEGEIALVFGVQAIHLYYEHGHFQTYEELAPGSAVARAMAPRGGRKKTATKKKSVAPKRQVTWLSDDRAFFTLR